MVTPTGCPLKACLYQSSGYDYALVSHVQQAMSDNWGWGQNFLIEIGIQMGQLP